MKKITYLLISFLFINCSKESSTLPVEDNFVRAADMSYLPLIESENTLYYNANSVVEDPLVTLKKAGCTTIRIRLWKNPIDSHCGYNEVLNFSQRIKQAGLKVWLCIHYSDTWADPGTQTTPQEWENLNYSELKTAFLNYTSMVVNEIKPDIVQIGNEVNNGFMWPKGNLYSNENQFIELINAATNRIKTEVPNTKILIHYAGIDANTVVFFNKLNTINYDYIGLSYYPIWHGKNIIDLKNRINNLGELFNKKVIVAETSYPFTLNYNDFTNNIVGLNNQLIPDFPATEQGQKDYLMAIKNTVKTSNYGMGFCYWGTEWVAFRGQQSTNGSPYENQSLWDFNNKVLPALSVFNKN